MPLPIIRSADRLEYTGTHWLFDERPLEREGIFYRETDDFLYLRNPLEFFKNARLRDQILENTRGNRLNLIGNELSKLVGYVEDWNRSNFSWFVVFSPPSPELPPQTSTFSPEIICSQKPSPSPDEQTVLLDAWNRDYIQKYLRSYSEELQRKQYDSLTERFSEGVHLLFRHQEQLVGHGCWVEVEHSLLRKPCLYWHEWVSPSLPLPLRREIHHRFFWEVKKKRIGLMSGVAVVNLPSLKHCLRNHFLFPIVSIRLKKEKQI